MRHRTLPDDLCRLRGVRRSQTVWKIAQLDLQDLWLDFPLRPDWESHAHQEPGARFVSIATLKIRIHNLLGNFSCIGRPNFPPQSEFQKNIFLSAEGLDLFYSHPISFGQNEFIFRPHPVFGPKIKYLQRYFFFAKIPASTVSFFFTRGESS